jgi:hypothetical protein
VTVDFVPGPGGGVGVGGRFSLYHGRFLAANSNLRLGYNIVDRGREYGTENRVSPYRAMDVSLFVPFINLVSYKQREIRVRVLLETNWEQWIYVKTKQRIAMGVRAGYFGFYHLLDKNILQLGNFPYQSESPFGGISWNTTMRAHCLSIGLGAAWIHNIELQLSKTGTMAINEKRRKSGIIDANADLLFAVHSRVDDLENDGATLAFDDIDFNDPKDFQKLGFKFDGGFSLFWFCMRLSGGLLPGYEGSLRGFGGIHLGFSIGAFGGLS